MKDKVFQIRTEQDTLDKLAYIQEMTGAKTTAETIRTAIEWAYNRVYKPENTEAVSVGDVVAPQYYGTNPGMVINVCGDYVEIITRAQERFTYPMRRVDPTGIHWNAEEVLKKMRGEPSIYDKK